LQEIGAEVGIEPARIAEAARAVGLRPLAPPQPTFLGAPRSVSRLVCIPRALDEDEWTRLVVDLRETFGAMGRIRDEGSLRSWTNGNLQVHVEPHGDAYRVRMRTLKGDLLPRLAVGAFFTVVAGILLTLTLLGEATTSQSIMWAVFGAAGLGTLGHTRWMLGGWARERAAQMGGIAERIPRLLDHPGVGQEEPPKEEQMPPYRRPGKAIKSEAPKRRRS
jgi:hypothetical protein